jgi:capsular polysaccharide biosynthesis protein
MVCAGGGLAEDRVSAMRRLPVRRVSIAKAVGSWHETDAESSYSLHATQIGRRAADLSSRLDPKLPALGVLELPDGAVVSQDGWVYDRRGRLVCELSWFGRHWDDARKHGQLRRRPRRLERLAGRTLTLGTTWGAAFGHFETDALGRLAIVERAGFTIGDFDHVLVPAPRSPAAQTLLDRVGVAPERLRILIDVSAYIADELFAPSYPGARRLYSPVIVDYLRGLTRPSRSPHRKLYVTRRGHGRDLVNVDEVEGLVRDFGFEVYDPGKSSDQASDFAEAAVVVGPSGSGLQNVVFCAPGTTVVELFSDAHVYAYHATLAQAAGLRYGYVLGESEEEPPAWGPSRADFVITKEELIAALEWTQST